ncbi:CLUMA_CG004751, isoform A [Clunio marinus]|uniref:CLUMA_CG004751, isoform A n=1 Tax=Clunio marinus TaxID=568069 RepID=A0A1J1HSM8_9DIPT|nr:CLUMA_CG004751, isoform A [Clunio marinus]
MGKIWDVCIIHRSKINNDSDNVTNPSLIELALQNPIYIDEDEMISTSGTSPIGRTRPHVPIEVEEDFLSAVRYGDWDEVEKNIHDFIRAIERRAGRRFLPTLAERPREAVPQQTEERQAAANNHGNRAENVTIPSAFYSLEDEPLTDNCFDFQAQLLEQTIKEERERKRYGFALVFIDMLEDMVNKKIDYDRQNKGSSAAAAVTNNTAVEAMAEDDDASSEEYSSRATTPEVVVQTTEVPQQRQHGAITGPRPLEEWRSVASAGAQAALKDNYPEWVLTVHLNPYMCSASYVNRECPDINM